MTSFQRIFTNGFLLCGLLVLSACSTLQKPIEGVSSQVANVSGRVAEAFRPYRTEVVQGNVVTREQQQLLRVGMTRLQVRDLLGTPLITSVFHANRWDYAFTIRRQGAEPLHRKLSVFFEGDGLARVEADELPLEAEFAARLGYTPSGRQTPRARSQARSAGVLQESHPSHPHGSLPGTSA